MNRASGGRVFMVMQEADKGYGRNGAPQGYLKLEVKQNELKALVHVQNIAPMQANHALQAYLLSSVKKMKIPLNIGTIVLKNGCGDISCSVRKQQLIKANIQSMELDTIVILCKDIDKEKIIAFPLVGFKNSAWDWRATFKEYKSERVPQQRQEVKVVKSSSQQENRPEKSKQKEIKQTKQEPLEQEEAKQQTNTNQAQKVKEMQKKHKNNTKYQKSNEAETIIPGFSKLRLIENPMSEGYKRFEWRLVQNCHEMMQSLYATNNHAITQIAFQIINHFYTIHAIRRYGYYLIGVLCDKKACTEKIAWAIPGRYGIEPHPLLHIQAHAAWVAQTGEKKTMGSFGYWIVVVDVKKGMLVE